MNDFPCRPAFAHRAVGDEGGAREVAGVLEEADEEEEQQDLRQEDDDRADAAPDALDEERPEQRRREERARATRPDAATARSTSVHERARRREDRLEDRDDDDEEDERPRDGMQEDGVEPARPDRRRGRRVARLVAHARRPTARHFGMSARTGRSSDARHADGPAQELADRLEALALAPRSRARRARRAASRAPRRPRRRRGSPARRPCSGRRASEARGRGSGAARTRWRLRFVESRIRRMASGFGMPSISPVRTSCVTRSSSERGDRL